MQTAPIGIIGASGYSGLEASRILAQHPRAGLRLLASDRWQGETAGRRAGLSGRRPVMGPAAFCFRPFQP